MSWVEITIAVLKFISIFLTGAFGVYGLLNNYKDKEGNVTPAGRRALYGILFSALIGATTQGVEIIKNSIDAEQKRLAQLEQLKRNEKVLNDINRILNPLELVRASFWLKVDLNHPELISFKNRFESEVKELIPLWEANPHTRVEGTVAYPSVMSIEGKVVDISVRQDDRLFPDRISEKFAYTVFDGSSITIYFYKNPINIDQFPSYGAIDLDSLSKIHEPDITMSFEQDYDSPWDISLEYSVDSSEYYVRGHSIISDKKYWSSSGKIVSFLDLAGSQVFITAGHHLVSFEEEEKRVNPIIKSVSLDIDSREGIWFRNKKMKMHIDPVDGERICEYVFPSTIDSLISEMR